jgi:hypothetical protein
MTVEITDDQLEKINKSREGREGQKYVSEDEAMQLNDTPYKKTPITREQLDADLTDSPFVKVFRFGTSSDGYWTHRHMRLQIEDLVDCLKVILPHMDALLLLDQSSGGHTVKVERRLDVANMNKLHGGVAAIICELKLTEGCIGLFDATLSVLRDSQEMNWPSADEVTEGMGPCYFTEDKRIANKLDRLEPATSNRLEEKDRQGFAVRTARKGCSHPFGPWYPTTPGIGAFE